METETEFVKDMNIVESYMKEVDSASAELKDFKDDIFGNFKDIADFHEKYAVSLISSLFRSAIVCPV